MPRLMFLAMGVPCPDMKWEFTAIIEAAPEGGFWAVCPEVPGANGQGESVEEARASLREASVWSWRIGLRTLGEAFPRTQSKRSSPWNEAEGLGAHAPTCGLLPEARGWSALALDQSKDWSC